MIEFKKNGKPVVTNKKCLKCCEECKQHIAIRIIVCPNYKPRDSDLAV